MKKVAVVFAALFVAMILTSCGSADTASTETSGTVAGAVPATPETSPPTPVETKLEVPRVFEIGENTPQFFQDALKQKEPILVMFYSEDTISQEVMAAVNGVYENEKYSGIVKFLLLKIADEDDILDNQDKEANEEIIELARNFGVGYVPHTAVLNSDGAVVFEKKGYVDIKVLEQALYSAAYK